MVVLICFGSVDVLMRCGKLSCYASRNAACVVDLPSPGDSFKTTSQYCVYFP